MFNANLSDKQKQAEFERQEQLSKELAAQALETEPNM